MAERITDYWTQFAERVIPNTANQPRWDPYTAETHNTLMLNVEGQQIAGALRDKVDLLDLFLHGRSSTNKAVYGLHFQLFRWSVKLVK